jgi:hypothetical protein
LSPIDRVRSDCRYLGGLHILDNAGSVGVVDSDRVDRGGLQGLPVVENESGYCSDPNYIFDLDKPSRTDKRAASQRMVVVGMRRVLPVRGTGTGDC